MAKGKKTPATGAQTPATPKGAQTPAVIEKEDLKTPAVVGINFGNTYASIAVISKEGLATCIANEDGERQIACAISYHGEQTYIGNGATQQLVKNADNTITGFRNLIGKKFTEIQHQPTNSAVVIQHPSLPDTIAYKVHVGTNDEEKVLSVSEVTTLFLSTLLKSAEQFLGRKPTGSVISVPTSFTPAQRAALREAAEATGVSVLQLLDEAGAVTVSSTASVPAADTTTLVVDLGQTALNLDILSIRHGLAHSLASASDSTVSARNIDDALLKFFAKEFTKKTKTALTLPATDKADQRAEAKLRLALEHTKRTIAASPGAASCAVESLKDGLDLAGTINRMRFDMEARPVYNAVVSSIRKLLERAELDSHQLHELIFVGGSGALPGLREAVAAVCDEEVHIGELEATEITSVGCALQADLLARLEDDSDKNLLWGSVKEGGESHEEVEVLSRTIGILFPGTVEDEHNIGGLWVPIVKADTVVPCRRTVSVDVSSGLVGFEVWEANEKIIVKLEKPPKLEASDEEDEEEEEEEVEVRDKLVEKETLLGGISVETKGAKAKLRVQIVVTSDSKVEVQAWEEGIDEKTKVLFG